MKNVFAYRVDEKYGRVVLELKSDKAFLFFRFFFVIFLWTFS